MPRPSSVNLHALDQVTITLNALRDLARSDCGPLRLKKKIVGGETVHYLGVRSWQTFFFEKTCASPAEIRQAKLATRKAIDEHIRPFLHEATALLEPNPEALACALQSKVSGKSIQPTSRKDGDSQGGTRNTAPAFRNATATLFDEIGTVPTGVSFAVVSPLKIIADVLLVTTKTFNSEFKTDRPEGRTVKCDSISPPPSQDYPSRRQETYRRKYLAFLNDQFANIRSSVVLELQPDDGEKCSNENLLGALVAAEDFRQRIRPLEKPAVSIMLITPNLPSAEAMAQRNPATNVLVPQVGRRDTYVLSPDSDSDSESSSD